MVVVVFGWGAPRDPGADRPSRGCSLSFRFWASCWRKRPSSASHAVGAGGGGPGWARPSNFGLVFLNPLQLGKCRCLGRPAVRDCAGHRRSCVVRGEVFVFGRRGKICVSFCPPSGSLAVGEVVRVTLPLCLCFCLECWTESGLGSGWFLQSAEQMEMTWLLVAAETKNTVEV